MTQPESREQERRKAIDDLYAVFAPDVVLEAEVEAILARIVAIDAALPSSDSGLRAAIQRLPTYSMDPFGDGRRTWVSLDGVLAALSPTTGDDRP